MSALLQTPRDAACARAPLVFQGARPAVANLGYFNKNATARPKKVLVSAGFGNQDAILRQVVYTQNRI